MPDPFVVSSHFKDDVAWLEDSGFSYLVVSKGHEVARVRNLAVVPNRGMEFGSYIWYVLNYWDRLPDKIAFIHGHISSYHQQHPTDDAIKIFGGADFAPLNGDFSAAIHRLNGDHPWFGRHFSDMWDFIGLNYVRPAPKVATIQPGTQTVVSRGLIESVGRPFWDKAFHRMVGHDAHRMLALVMEIAWPMIFGHDPEDNPHSVEEFRSFFELEDISILIANPEMAWNSSMNNSVAFGRQDSKKGWISSCMDAFRNYSKVV